MGEVFSAVDQRCDKTVAVKSTDLGRWGPTQRQSLLDQFRREGRTLLRLKHPNLPAFLDFFEENDQVFLVMELVPGQNLAQEVDQHGPFSDAELREMMATLASVLAFLHEQSPPVIFRDLKPGNVMVTPDKQIKLIDFGLAKSSSAGSGAPTQTSARGLVSPGFAAPEQYGGGTDERSDLYSLGATAYFLATAAVPPESVERATSRSRLTSPEQLNPDLSSSTALLITRLMDLKRDLRPSSAREVLEQLQGGRGEVHTIAVQGQDHTIPVQGQALPTRPKRRIAVSILAVLLVGFLIWFWRSEPSISPLHIETAPPGATVVLNEEVVGTTPCDIILKSDSEIRLELEGHVPVEDKPAKFSREPVAYFVQLREGSPGPDVKPAEFPGYYPPTRGGPPWPFVPSKTKNLDGHAYDLYDEFEQWSVVTSTDTVLELQKGDGQSGSLFRARFESGPTGPADELLRKAIEQRQSIWTLVRSVRQDQSVVAYFEHRDGAVVGRSAWVARISPAKVLQLDLEITPCPSPYEFIRVLDLMRTSLGLQEGDPI
jgi:serine/threonine protein kinase